MSAPRPAADKGSSYGQPPRRELDQERTGQRAGTPCNLIRRPVTLPTMRRVQR